MAAKRALAIIAGVGPGTGLAVAKRFAEAYDVVLLARSQSSYAKAIEEIEKNGGKAVGIPTDITDRNSVKNAFTQMFEKFPDASLAAGVYNVGGGFSRKPFLEMDPDELHRNFETCCAGAFYFAQQALPHLMDSGKKKMQHPPTLLFTGATASMKGSPQCETFSPGKFALRSLTQSLAKEFGPQGVHVSHVIIDGVINIEKTKGYNVGAEDGKLEPEGIADSYFHLHSQSRTNWTWEMDLRPYSEKW